MTYRDETQQRQKLTEILSDPEQRLNKLYSIVDKNAKRIPFHLNKTQQDVYDLIKAGKRRIIIYKSRQQGYSSLFGRIALDNILFKRNFNSQLLFDTEANASRFFKSHIRETFNIYGEKFPDLAKLQEITENTQTSMRNVLNSTIDCSLRVRSATVNYLHISEFALISMENPDRAEEIVTGGFPAVTPDGTIIIETTSRGKIGECYRLAELAMDNKAKGRHDPEDWHIHFSGWTGDSSCNRRNGDIDPYVDKYALELHKRHGININDSQKKWYTGKWLELREKMKNEYPTVLSECFEISNEGSIFADQLMRAKEQGRIMPVPPDPNLRTFATCDLGMSDSTSICVFQTNGNMIHHVYYYENNGEPIGHYSSWLRSLPIQPEMLILPHDAKNRNLVTGTSVEQKCRELGWNVKVLPRTPDIWLGINEFRSIIDGGVFNVDEYGDALTKLEAYRRKFNKAQNMYGDDPLHDWTSHCADAHRYIGEAKLAGFLQAPSVSKNKNRRPIQNKVGRKGI